MLDVNIAQNALNELVSNRRLLKTPGLFTESEWMHIYCQAKHAPTYIRSSKPFNDFIYDGLGVESKLIQKITNQSLSSYAGSKIMLIATRKIQFDPNQTADECKKQILTQYGHLLLDFKQRVQQSNCLLSPQICYGVVFWKPSLEEILYFEHDIQIPNPDDYTAWFVGQDKKLYRKQTSPDDNLWIFYKGKQRVLRNKAFCITMPKHGSKLHVYCTVPPVGQGSYLFTTQACALEYLAVQSATSDALNSLLQPNQTIDELIMQLIEQNIPPMGSMQLL